MSVPETTSLLAAALVGLTGSLHCFLMCGPLACAASTSSKGARWRTLGAYQVGRILGYAATGAISGGVGGGVAGLLRISTAPLLPWLMAAAFLASALDLGTRLRPVPGFSRLLSSAMQINAKLSPTLRAGAIGALTALLPCGLLYAALLMAAATGGAGPGAVLMGAFALGAAPALALAQVQRLLWRKEGKVAAFILRRVVPVAAAVVLIARATASAAASRGGAPPHCH